jgi:hypothetical protein
MTHKWLELTYLGVGRRTLHVHDLLFAIHMHGVKLQPPNVGNMWIYFSFPATRAKHHNSMPSLGSRPRRLQAHQNKSPSACAPDTRRPDASAATSPEHGS